jgi:NAD+ synthetase
MPSHITSSETKSDAYKLAEKLGIVCHERPIVNEYNAWLEEARVSLGEEPKSLTKQNKQARIRYSILMEYSNEKPGSCHLNTGNKTEIALGYFTLGGDSGGALSVIGDVNKLRVYELARFINRLHHQEIIPATTIDRPPSAELEVGQTDENSLPAGYDVLVPLVDKIIETDTTFEELAQEFGEKVVADTILLIRRSEAKRRQLPPAIRITDRSFGIERRVPMDYPLETITL